MKRESFRKGMKDGVPIALGYFAVSFTFGMMAVAGGLRIWQAVLISPDQPDIGRSVCGTGHYFCGRLHVGDGNDPADHQPEILPDVIFPVPEIPA